MSDLPALPWYAVAVCAALVSSGAYVLISEAVIAWRVKHGWRPKGWG